ncbi:epoxide hydrolase family protein [Zavarzinia sp. CC-PAN008]|uniref:epoxide hydrolase family protein n=1 Tax=Zavarzinia sp. CC-PAN008 TaxID=3243332 RepID=UPI003F748613
MATIEPFRIAVPEARLQQVLAKVRAAEFPPAPVDSSWAYGAESAYVRDLVHYWGTQFDWRKAEEGLNRYPQFRAEVEGIPIHFVHVKGKGPTPLPLILTHGWPGSFFEFLHMVDALTDPAAHGGDAADSFDVVIPSLPGYGFSGAPPRPIGPKATARMWHTLMTQVLGYSRFGAQGGDWGSAVSALLGHDFPDSLIGVHLNLFPLAAMPPEPSEEEKAWAARVATYTASEMGYFNEHATKPMTPAFALHDSPAGLAAWIVEKFAGWSDIDGDIESVYSKDELLTNIAIYALTGTIGTSIWMYRGMAEEAAVAPPFSGPIPVPTAFAQFPKDIAPWNPPRSVVQRGCNLKQMNTFAKGGHFAALEQPEALTGDIRSFFRGLR